MIAPKPGPKLEAVSSRLKGSLIHPNKVNALRGLHYSPDGKRIIACNYPSGVLQLWNVETGKQLTKIEAGSQRFHLTPDWKTVYAPRGTRKATQFEKDGKKLYRLETDGDVRAWDLTSGQLKETFKHSPSANVMWTGLSPNGSSFVTLEELSGEFERVSKRATSLWDVKTKKYRALPGNFFLGAMFSPDGKFLVASEVDDDYCVTAIKRFDVHSLKEQWSTPIAKGARADISAFTPDGEIMVGSVQTAFRRDNSQSFLKFWDAETGKELASFPAEEKKSAFTWMGLAQDGTILFAVTWRGEKSRLYLIDVRQRKFSRTIVLGDKTFAHRPVFSPDGKWLAVVTQVRPDDVGDVDELPQPRILLIETATGEIRETLIAPQGAASGACFSPNGKTLATGGRGKVYLWDLTKPPESVVPKSER